MPQGLRGLFFSMTSFDLFRLAHIGAGSVALASFWIPMVVTKGGLAHRRAGWTYAVSMWLAALMALVLCGLRLGDDLASNDPSAIFLAFVGLLSANGAATGVRVVRTKTRTEGHRNPFDLGLSGVLLASSLGLAAYGVAHGSTLFLSFSGLGLFLSVGQLRFWLQPPASKLEWWLKHMGSMLAACIGTVTAFLVVNVSRFGLDQYALFFWLGPGVVGGLGIAVWQRRYRKQFAASS